MLQRLQRCKIASNHQDPRLACQTPKHAFAWCGIPSARNRFQLTTSQSSQSCFPYHREMLHQVQPHKHQSSYLQLQSFTQSEDYTQSCSLCTSTWSSKDPSRHLSGLGISHCCPDLGTTPGQSAAPITMGQHQHQSSRCTIACWLESRSFKIALP